MDAQLNAISSAGMGDAIAKAELYRYSNEPEEAESICRDILAVDSAHQLARRLLGLSITDQFSGYAGDRYGEVAEIFQGLRDPYERAYYTGLLYERRAKVQLRSGYSAHILLPLIVDAMKCFAEAEKIRPPGNDDSIPAWNRFLAPPQKQPRFRAERDATPTDAEDTPPQNVSLKRAGKL